MYLMENSFSLTNTAKGYHLMLLWLCKAFLEPGEPSHREAYERLAGRDPS